ncbi:hypothetical protein ACIBQ7_35875 [Streptomyces massasporeus]|uniref:hypothetical protein n=1 Tax=Streptomyces massasporeus TaxID=67324 RepID=UPI0037B3294F
MGDHHAVPTVVLGAAGGEAVRGPEFAEDHAQERYEDAVQEAGIPGAGDAAVLFGVGDEGEFGGAGLASTAKYGRDRLPRHRRPPPTGRGVPPGHPEWEN